MTMRDMDINEYMRDVGMPIAEAMIQSRCETNLPNSKMSKAFHSLIMTIGVVDMGRAALHGGDPRFSVKPGMDLTEAQIATAKQVIFKDIDKMRAALDEVEQFYRTV